MARIVTKKRRGGVADGKADGVIRIAAVAVCVVCAVIAAMRFVKRPRETGLPGEGVGALPGAEVTPEPGGQGPAAPARLPAADGASSGDASGKSGADALAASEAETPSSDGGAAAGAGEDASVRPSAEVAEKPQVLGAVKDKEYFDNGVENTLALVSEPGAEFFGFPSIPDLDDEEVLAFLRRPVEIYDDDDEATIAVKERTAEFKTRALEAIEKDGLTFNQFVRDLVALRNEQSAMREDARNEMVKIFKAGGVEAANAYLEKVNPELKAQGLQELVIPQWLIDNPDLL